MKKLISLLVCTIVCLNMHGQELTTIRITDWNILNKSYFVESCKGNNDPANHEWYWGINIGRNKSDSFYNGQIAFGVNYSVTHPNVYVRSTYVNGDGTWAKLVHSKGNHAIDGKLTVKEVEVKINTGADFVFQSDYKLLTLPEVENHIKENNHLPDIPSEKEMIENGVNINEMQIKLLQKIEELTLYVIEQNKEIQKLKIENKEIKERLQNIN